MKSEQLLAFCSAAKFKNITQAAESLGMTQPGLSRQLAALQEAIGETLYERTAYGIELTPSGEALLPYACAVAQTLSQAKNFISDKENRLKIELQLGISHSLVPKLTPRFLRKMNTLKIKFPNINIILTEGYSEILCEQVLQRQLDSAYIIEPFSQPLKPLKSSILGGEIIGLYVPPEHYLATQALVSITDLKDETLIVPSSVSTIFKRVQSCLARNNIQTKSTLEVSGPTGVVSGVKHRLGLGVGLWSYLNEKTNAEQLQFVQIEEKGFEIASLRITQPLNTLEASKREAIDFINNLTD